MPLSNNYVKNTYPRKCECCDYVSNNPSMYHYHKKTHEPIPADTLCWQGCGKVAMFRGTGGKYTCCKVTQQCSAYFKKHSERQKEYWQRPNAMDKIQKQILTKKEKFNSLKPDEVQAYRRYASRCRKWAQKWAKDQGYVLGQQTYHVDHKLSILDAFRLNLPAAIVNHPANLQIIEAKKNSSKGSTSILTVDELIVLTQASNQGN